MDAIKQFFMGACEIAFGSDLANVELAPDCRDEAHKYEVLVELYNLLTIGQSIIFVKVRSFALSPRFFLTKLSPPLQRRDTADEIAKRMSAEGHQVTSLHGKLETGERDAVMESFRDGKTKVLITTNVIARGIDVLQVNMVVNYDLPLDANNKPDPETYLHRIGASFCQCCAAWGWELIPFLSQVERVALDVKESRLTLCTTASHSRTWSSFARRSASPSFASTLRISSRWSL